MVLDVLLYPDLDFFPILDPGLKKAPDPGSGSATLKLILKNSSENLSGRMKTLSGKRLKTRRLGSVED
jgi:hypothetical protein